MARWERERRLSVTLGDIRHAVGDPPAKDVARSLVRKGALERVTRGIYLVRPFRTLLRRSTPSSVVVVSTFLRGEPHYLGGLWALTHHRLTSQQHASLIDVFVSKRHKTAPRSLAKIKFHVVPRTAFLYGIESTEFEGLRAQVSDPERTLLDLLDYPRVAGSMSHALALFKHGVQHVDDGKLVAYAVRGSRLATCQRLGVLLQRNRASARLLGPLVKRAGSRKSLLSMNPGVPREGHLNTRWNIIENDQ